MRKLIALVVPIVALLTLGSAPASAETDNVGCLGSGGYESTGTWTFNQTQVETPLGIGVTLGCKIYSPDNYNPPSAPSTGGQPLLELVEPSSLPNVEGSANECLASNGTSVFAVTCTALSVGFPVLNQVCTNSPGGCSLLGNSLSLTSYAFASFANVSLTGTGTFKCGNGELSGEGYDGNGPEANFKLKWTATFHNGVGEVSGTATSEGNPADDPSDAAGAVKTLGGKMLIGDGSAGETCGNDTNPNQVVALDLHYTG